MGKRWSYIANVAPVWAAVATPAIRNAYAPLGAAREPTLPFQVAVFGPATASWSKVVSTVPSPGRTTSIFVGRRRAR